MPNDNFFNRFLKGNKSKDKDAIKSNIDVYDLASTLKNEGNGSINSDVTGSYTGMTNDNEKPIQDADDL